MDVDTEFTVKKRQRLPVFDANTKADEMNK